jgi:cytochrome c-type biogenesis protein CcmH/NrfG
MSNDLSEILEELKRLGKKVGEHTTVVVIVLIGLTVSTIYQNHFSSARNRDRSHEDNWRSATNEMDMLEFDKAAAIVQRLIDKNPNYYYGYSFLGYIALQKNELKEAEKQFARAYELFPTSDNEQKLRAVQKRLAAETLK